VLISLGLDFTHADVATARVLPPRLMHRGGWPPTPVRGEGSSSSEFLAVNTCNRVELYGWATDGGPHPYQDLHLLRPALLRAHACEAARFMRRGHEPERDRP
jgi:hypothetical protein